jgi:hypothetical protein
VHPPLSFTVLGYGTPTCARPHQQGRASERSLSFSFSGLLSVSKRELTPVLPADTPSIRNSKSSGSRMIPLGATLSGAFESDTPKHDF